MSTVTPILDTLLHQVLGRRASLERFTATRSQLPLLPIDRSPASRGATSQTTSDSGTTQQTKTTGTRSKAAEQLPGRIADPARQSSGKTALAPQATSAQLHFSREGQAISALLSRFATAPMATSYTHAPLFSSPRPPAASMLAAILGRQVAYSGVFYESHLQKWLKGQRSLKQLKQEPQGKLHSTGRGTSASKSPTPTPMPGQSTPGHVHSTPTPGAASGAAMHKAPTLAASLTGQYKAAEPIHKTLLPVVRQQLDVLSASTFRWQGLAWPDVPMQWEIHRHEPGANSSDDTDNPDEGMPYSTRLKLELPTLGTLEVHIVLSANTLQMYAWAGTDKGATVLGPNAPDLKERLEQAGFDSASVQFLADKENG